jgi:hypothetical protein
MPSIDYREGFSAVDFVALANRVWPRDYVVARAEEAISRTIDIRGIGREMMTRALERAPRGALFFGAQPQSASLFERIGCTPGPVGFVLRKKSA